MNFDAHNFTGFGDLMDVSKRFTRNAKQFSMPKRRSQIFAGMAGLKMRLSRGMRR